MYFRKEKYSEKSLKLHDNLPKCKRIYRDMIETLMRGLQTHQMNLRLLYRLITGENTNQITELVSSSKLCLLTIRVLP